MPNGVEAVSRSSPLGRPNLLTGSAIMQSLSWIDTNGSLHDFYNYLERGPESIRNIHVPTVEVTDHLRRVLPIPLIFCSTWEVDIHMLGIPTFVRWHTHTVVTQSFDYIINCHCRNSVGYDFIRRGEYAMIDGQDNKVIHRSKFVESMRPGTKCEISIVMRQTTEFNKTCPQCRYPNYGVDSICGWIKWQVLLHYFTACLLIDHSLLCSKQFEVVTKRCPRCKHMNLNISVKDNWIEWYG